MPFRALFLSTIVVGLFAIGPTAQAQDKTIKIGALLCGTGLLFWCAEQGVELALESNSTKLRACNGYKKFVHSSIRRDSACSPLPATQAAKHLIEQFDQTSSSAKNARMRRSP